MIIQGLLTVVSAILSFVFGLLPNLPSLPAVLLNDIDKVVNIIFDNVSLVGLFVPLTTVKILIPLVIIVMNFDNIYSFVWWVIRKIPFLNIR